MVKFTIIACLPALYLGLAEVFSNMLPAVEPDFNILFQEVNVGVLQAVAEIRGTKPRVIIPLRPQVDFETTLGDASYIFLDPDTLNVNFKLDHEFARFACTLISYTAITRYNRMCTFCRNQKETVEH